MGVEVVMKFVEEKMKEGLLAAGALGRSDGVLPLETRTDTVNHWLVHVALPWMFAAVVVTVVICFCRCCCKRCCGREWGRLKMIRDPNPPSTYVPGPEDEWFWDYDD